MSHSGERLSVYMEVEVEVHKHGTYVRNLRHSFRKPQRAMRPHSCVALLVKYGSTLYFDIRTNG
jgi:hypothetical protein